MEEKNIQASSRIAALISGYLLNQLSAKEVQELEAWINTSAANAAIFKRGLNEENLERQGRLLKTIEVEADMQAVKNSLDFEPAIKRVKLWPRIISIAAAVIGTVVCVYLYRPADAPLSSRVSRDLNDIPPGGNRATLTANGNTINLSEKQTGVVVGDDIKYIDGTDIAPLSSRTRPDLSGANAKDLSLQVSTPRGGTYSIILQDGTKVWLNADSKLEFFSNYRNKLQRIVKLITGEAYFEVAKNRAKPFLVQSNGQVIEVLGTHFNISAYSDDIGIRTTLLEGSVRVSSSSPTTPSSRGKRSDENRALRELTDGKSLPAVRDDVVLKPGQQSLVTTNNEITIKEVDASEAVAWKNGLFSFKNASLQTVMRQLARWYDVEIVYQGEPANSVFTGEIYRSATAAQALKLLEYTHVKFKIEGKKIIVVP